MSKAIPFVLIIVATINAAFAQSEDSDAKKLQRSAQTWEKLKATCNGNYSYKVRWSSFAGFGHVTEMVIRDNKVVERRFKPFASPRRAPVAPNAAPKAEEGWVEKGKALGSHKQGAPVKTLDQLYGEAAKIVKRELPPHERRYVRFDAQGLLLSCFTVDTRIADDAPIKGVRISEISLMGVEKIYKAPNGKPFPVHWGPPPRIQTRDLRPLPGGFGRGSGTLSRWIQENLDRDKRSPPKK